MRINMWQKIRDLLNSPYPVYLNRWKGVWMSGLIVFAVIYLFQPFGFYDYSGNKILGAMGYGVATMLGVWVASFGMDFLFKTWHKEQNWTVGKMLLNSFIIVVLIAFLNTLYEFFIFHFPINLFGLRFSFMLVGVFIVAFIPITLFAIWNRNLTLSRNLAEAQLLNLSLQASKKEQHGAEKATSSVLLSFADGTKEHLTVEARQLLYCEADGNYVHVAFLKGDGSFCQQMLRTTMKQVEEVVANCSDIVRCHRAFMVNLSHVVALTGNSQGYRLLLDVEDKEVPMSRSYAAAVKQQIAPERV